MEYVKNGFLNWYKFNGRSSRVEYWSTYLFTFTLFYLYLFSTLFTGSEGIIAIFGSLGVIYSLFVSIGLGVRRMHDAGVSGVFIIIPFVNIFYAVSKSEQKENKWGPVPFESKEDSINQILSQDVDITKAVESKEATDDELEELKERLVELQELKKAQDAAELEKNSKKEEILKQIEDLKKELDE